MSSIPCTSGVKVSCCPRWSVMRRWPLRPAGGRRWPVSCSYNLYLTPPLSKTLHTTMCFFITAQGHVFLVMWGCCCFPECCLQSHHQVEAVLWFPWQRQHVPSWGTPQHHCTGKLVRTTQPLDPDARLWCDFDRCFSVTPRVPDVSAIMAPAGRTPRYTHTPKNVLSSVVRRKYPQLCFLCLNPFMQSEMVLVLLQNLDDSDWTNSYYTSPISAMENTSFFTEDITNLSSALLKEDDPGEAGRGLKRHVAVAGVKEFVIWLCSLLFAAAASLFPEFLGVFHKNTSTAVFDLLEDYQALCQDKVGAAPCTT